MTTRAIRPLLALSTCFLLLTAACDKAEETKADDKKADKAEDKTDVKAEEKADEKAEDKAPEPPADSGAAATVGVEPPAEAGADAGATAGEPAAEAGEDKPTEDKPTEDKPAEKKPAETKEPAPTVAKVDGKPIFEAKCKSCHGADGKGDTTIGKKVNIPSLAGTSMSKDKVIATVENGVPDTKMKGYKDKLSAEEIEAVAVYVKKL